MNKQQVEQLTEQLHYYIFHAPLSAETKARVKAIKEELERLKVPEPKLGLTLSQFQLLYNNIVSWPCVEKQSAPKRTHKYIAALGILLAVLIAGFINQHLYVSAIKPGYVRLDGNDTTVYGFFHLRKTVEVPISVLDQSVPIPVDTLLLDNYTNLYLPWNLLQNSELYQLSLLHTSDGYIISLDILNTTIHIQKGLRLPWELPEDAILQNINSNPWDNSDIYLSGNTIYAKFEIKGRMYFITSTLAFNDFMNLINSFRPYDGNEIIVFESSEITLEQLKDRKFKELYLPEHLLSNPSKYKLNLMVSEGNLDNFRAEYYNPETEQFISFSINDKFGTYRITFVGDRLNWPETQPPYHYLKAMYSPEIGCYQVTFVSEQYLYQIISNLSEEEIKELIQTMDILEY